MQRSTGRRSISCPSSWVRGYLCSGSGPCAVGSPSLPSVAWIGIALCVYALALHPLIALVAGRPLHATEVVGLAPDPTASATLGLLSLAPRRGGTLPLII